MLRIDASVDFHYKLRFLSTSLLLIFAMTSAVAANSTKAVGRVGEKRTLQFPNDSSLGRLILVPDIKDLGEAKGKVTFVVPAGSYVRLDVANSVAKNPNSLKKVPVQGIDAVKLKYMSLEEGAESVCDKEIKAIVHLKDLTHLNLTQSDISDLGMEPVVALKKLTEVSLFGTEIHGSCFETLKFLPALTSLDASFTSLETMNFKFLTEMKNLKNLNLRKTGINREAARLIGKCKSLEALSIGLNRRVDDECMDRLLTLKNLQRLNIDETAVTKAGVLKLTSLPLKYICLPGSVQSAADMAQLHKDFPHCILERSGINRPVTKFEKRVFAPLK